VHGYFRDWRMAGVWALLREGTGWDIGGAVRFLPSGGARWRYACQPEPGIAASQ
jgi:hypothetical protein